MSQFQDWNLQLLVGECRRIGDRHQDREVRTQAEELMNEYLVLVTRPFTPEEAQVPQRELRLKLVDFVEANQTFPS
jgi:hypothetical protein